MAEAELNTLIRAKNEADKVFKETQNSIQGMSKQLKQAGIAMTAFGGITTAALFSTAKAAADEQVNVEHLAVALKNVGIAYDEVRGTLEATITATQRKTGIADTEQRDILSRLLLVTNDYQKALDLLPTALDLAAAGQMDATTAATYLGKAYEDLEKGADSVSIRLGQASVKFESLEEIQDRVAGSAEALANPFTILSDEMSDLKEKIGSFLLPVLTDLKDKIIPIIDRIKAWTDAHPKLTEQLLIIAGAIGGVSLVVGPLLIMLPALMSGFTLLLGPVGWAALALMGIVTAGVLIYENWDKIVEGVKNVRDWFVWLGDTIKNTLLKAFDWLKEHLLWFIAPPLGLLLSLATGTGNVKEAFERLANMIMGALKKALDWLKDKLEALISPLKKAKEWVDKLIHGSGLSELTISFKRAAEMAEEFGWAAVTQAFKIEQVKRSVDSLSGSLDNLASKSLGELISLGYLSAEELPATMEEWLAKGGYMPGLPAEFIAADVARAQAGEAAYQAKLAQYGVELANGATYLSPYAGMGGSAGGGSYGMGSAAYSAAMATWSGVSFQHGGELPYTGLFYGHKGEQVISNERGLQAPLNINLDGKPIARYILKLVGGKLTIQGVTL
jgi:hypothetical protein